MPRPKSHYCTGKRSHVLRAKAPAVHSTRPDIDNLIKFYMDLLNKGFYVDDSQVCSLASIKVYSNNSEWNNDHPRTEVEIEEI